MALHHFTLPKRKHALSTCFQAGLCDRMTVHRCIHFHTYTLSCRFLFLYLPEHVPLLHLCTRKKVTCVVSCFLCLHKRCVLRYYCCCCCCLSAAAIVGSVAGSSGGGMPPPPSESSLRWVGGCWRLRVGLAVDVSFFFSAVSVVSAATCSTNVISGLLFFCPAILSCACSMKHKPTRRR